MGPTQLLSVSCGPAREQTKQTGGRRSRARNLDRGRAQPTAGRGERESRRKARPPAAAASLPANGASWTTSDPPSTRRAEPPLLSYSYGAGLHLRICESESSRKVKQTSKTSTSGQHRATSRRDFGSVVSVPGA